MRNYVEVVKQLIKASGTANTLVGCELGICQGSLSHHVLYKIPNIVWVMVDRWEAYPPDHPDNEPKFQSYFSQKCMDEWRERALASTLFAGDRRIVIQADCSMARRMIADNIFDFLFIDAAHDYENVKRDLKWWSKVKPRGIFAGHDYRENTGVPEAVDEWLEQHNQQLLQPIVSGIWAVRKDAA